MQKLITALLVIAVGVQWMSTNTYREVLDIKNEQIEQLMKERNILNQQLTLLVLREAE